MRHLVSTTIALLLLGLFLMPASAVAADSGGGFAGTAVGEAAFDLANSNGCPTPEDTPPGFGITTITDAVGTTGSGDAVSLHSAHCPLTTGGITRGHMTFTMADGDELHGTYTGTATPIPPNIGDPILVSVNITLDGGTGRYAHAVGTVILDAELVFEGLEDLAWPWKATWTGTVSYGVDASLQFSRSADRSEAAALDGATVNGSLYVFLNPLVPPEAGAISGVEFWANGALVHTECCAPYDMIGGTTDGSATDAWHTTEVPEGEATVTARILFDDGTKQDITATVTVDNTTLLPAEWGFGYSMNAARSDAKPLLQSYAVSGPVYLFVFPFDPGLSGPVDLYLDGELIRREYEAPYDLLGGSSNRAGVALDTTTLPDGLHQLSAIAVESNQQATVPFVVDNTPSEVETLDSFPQPGPEGIAADADGNLYATFAATGELRKLDPAGDWTTVASWEVGEGRGPLGLEVDGVGNAYVAVTTFNPENHGVYRVTPDGDRARLPGSEAIVFPNDVSFDRHGNLFVSDTVGGAVWRFAPEGTAEPWLVDPLLEGTGEAGFPFPLGANGVAWSDDTVYVANTEKGHVLAVPVAEDGSAGTPVVASHPQFIFPDGIAVGADGRIYTALIAQSAIAALDPATGELEYLATALDGIDWASSLTFGDGALDPTSLYAVNYAIGPPGVGPGLVRVETGVAGAPLVRPVPFVATFAGEVLAINENPADIAARCVERPAWAIVSFQGTAPETDGVPSHVLAEHCSYVGPLPDGTIGPDGTYGEGVLSFTAENGDILRGTYADGVSTSPPPDVGFIDFFTFAGGTGAYATAGGGGVEVGTVDFSAGFGPGAPFTVVMEGLIVL